MKVGKPAMVVKRPLTLKVQIGFSYKFIRVNPTKRDFSMLDRLVAAYKPYCGYDVKRTQTTSGKQRELLQGFLVFPVRVSMEYLRSKLPNFLVGFVKDFKVVETVFHNSETSVWINQHPFKEVKTDLLKKFDNALNIK